MRKTKALSLETVDASLYANPNILIVELISVADLYVPEEPNHRNTGKQVPGENIGTAAAEH
jgi:hypothetical protein